MRVMVVGAGGVGGLIGGLLARNGVDVAFVARGPQLAALREGGLRVQSPRGSFHVPRIEAGEHPGALAPADVIVVCVKSWQVVEVAPKLRGCLTPTGFAVPLENGVEAAEGLAAELGNDRVVGGLCALVAWLEAPGLVRHIGDPLRVVVGERPRGAPTPRLEALADVFRAARIDVVIAKDIEAAVWEKFLFICAFSGIGAVTRAPVGLVRTIPETRALLIAVVEEVTALARTRGVRIREDAAARAIAALDALAPEATASMQRDMQAGRPSELYDQTGAVVRMARERGLRVPVNEFLLGALLPQERSARRGDLAPSAAGAGTR